MDTNDRNTNTASRRHDRIAPFYDIVEGLMGMTGYRRWRELLWSKVEGRKIIEVGVGTGSNFLYYPKDAEITAIDLSEKMLDRAAAKASKQGIPVSLQQMDLQRLSFDNDTFDTAVASFVFCSVPDPVKGLAEIRRVSKPGGKVVLLEHVLSANSVLAFLMNLANPLALRVMGSNINRRTLDNVTKAGLKLEHVTDLAAGIFKLIEARA